MQSLMRAAFGPDCCIRLKVVSRLKFGVNGPRSASIELGIAGTDIEILSRFERCIRWTLGVLNPGSSRTA